jgi:hypothetical protein
MTQKVKDDKPLYLRDAVVSGRLDDFIQQEEGRGVCPIDSHELDTAIERTVRGSRSGDRTSHSASRRYSRGAKTR